MFRTLPKPSLLRLRSDALTVQRFNVRKPTRAYTLIELVLVVGIITVLTGLILSTVGYARKKGAMARAGAEIAAMSAAIENYKADNGIYPTDSDTTTNTRCRRMSLIRSANRPTTIRTASLLLYERLAVTAAGNRQSDRRKATWHSSHNMLLLRADHQQQPYRHCQIHSATAYGYSTTMAATRTRKVTIRHSICGAPQGG